MSTDMSNVPVDLPIVVELLLSIGLAAAHVRFLLEGYHSIVSTGGTDAWNPLWVPIAMPLLYLALIYIGRNVMTNARPLGLKYAMAIYNLYSTFLSLAMCVSFLAVLSEARPWTSLWTAHFPVSSSHERAAAAIFWVAMQVSIGVVGVGVSCLGL
jgi:hypothetical protein